jgi:hypothetical protein
MNTPETNKILEDQWASIGALRQRNCPASLVGFCRKLEIQRNEAQKQNALLREIAEKDDEKLDNEYNKTLDTELSIYCQAKWNAAIDDRDIANQEAKKLREQNAKLREIAENAD